MSYGGPTARNASINDVPTRQPIADGVCIKVISLAPEAAECDNRLQVRLICRPTTLTSAEPTPPKARVLITACTESLSLM